MQHTLQVQERTHNPECTLIMTRTLQMASQNTGHKTKSIIHVHQT
jgi:hypothetical protein